MARAARAATLVPMKFLKENWPWIVVPLVLFGAAVFFVISGSDPLTGNNSYSTR